MARQRTAPTVDAGEVASQLRLSITRLARRLRQESSTGYSPSQLSALAAIHNHGPLTLGALADHERVAPPTITKVVGKLEAEGLVERAAVPGDRRATSVQVSAAGRALIEETRRRKTSWLIDRIRVLPEGDQRRLAAALDVLEQLTTQDDPT